MNTLMHRLRAAVPRAPWNALRQRGSILVLTAFALPVALAGIGLSVDAGNVYMHKSRLQNAADAAAIGGAYSGMNWKTGAFDETAAGTAAEGYLAEDNGCDLTLQKHQLFYSANKSTKYYAVRADEDVPTMFMKYFGYTNVSISAKSIAKLHAEEGTHWFNDLFIFKDKLTNVNSIDSPDNFTLTDKIRTTFDGRIRYLNKNVEIQHSTQTNKLDVFFTRTAQNSKLSVDDCKAKTGASYDENGQDTTQGGGWWSKEQYDGTYDINAYWNDHISGMISGLTSTTEQNPKETAWNTSDILYYDLNKANNNINLAIEHDLPGDATKPAYLIIKAGTTTGLSVINIDVKADTTRPLIICLDPSDVDKGSQVHMNLNGHTFSGIVYAPTMSDEGILINANEGTFNGSLVARTLNLQGGRGHYVYAGIHEGGGTAGSGSASLTDDTDDIPGYDSF